MALHASVPALLKKQKPEGSWEGEVVWCSMILSQYVIVERIVGREIPEAHRQGILRHFTVTQTSEGGWGLHAESRAYVFVTALAYVALRLLGVDADARVCMVARQWLRAQPGGVLAIPTWGKFWLALVGLYGYEGLNPLPPELFSAPRWLPFHPSRLYCHTRLIYLGMAYLYGARFQADLGPIMQALRHELYDGDFGAIDFSAHRNHIASSDLRVRPSLTLRIGYAMLRGFERLHSAKWRKKALDRCFEWIRFEGQASRYQSLSPVNGLLHCISLFSRDPQSAESAMSFLGLKNWKWEDDASGIRYVGARSQTWDTAFSMQALLELPQAPEDVRTALRKAYLYLKNAQMTSELPLICDTAKYARDPVLGGWCFNDGGHRWPVSDCTAEAVCALLDAHTVPELIPVEERIPPENLLLAVKFILSRQNPDGGFATYEKRRAPALVERTNPSEMFGNCMTERSYVECTASCIKALSGFGSAYPNVEPEKITRARTRAIGFLRKQQRADGSFLGSWGINFTYATFFVVEALRSAGFSASESLLTRAGEWLLEHQRPDGGWGEHFLSCVTGHYVEHRHSQAVMTSWALLALMGLGPSHMPSVERGIAWLISRQQASGDFPDEAVNGVFFGSAMLDYRLYKSYFPVWALARRSRLSGQSS